MVDMPGLVEHLHFEAVPSIQSPMGRGDSGGGSVPGSRVLFPAALDAADELAALLGSWIDEVVRLHPAGLRGPSAWGWRFSAPERQVDPASGKVFLPAEHRLGASVDAVRSASKWLLPHLAWVAAQSWAGDMRAELDAAVSTAKARWPVEEPAHRVPMPCPCCGLRSLVYWPPREAGDAALVSCDSEDCGRLWVEDAWTRTVELVLARPDLVEEVAERASA
ncbi:hypothetical protein I6B53_03335 [Schaalia sp. 19OD2882]|uniref:hypothetical protein n=1 Tax=Schaalia sp. 19OD2882 TaxID=2794089 RepID=UPI001C1E927B|nr:hypothetical protein [Schaalia sp. 19OD2882]QWW20144.1 hypothetical protein I6B53_03335 [Schaalia sp. 19OD2882]